MVLEDTDFTYRKALNLAYWAKILTDTMSAIFVSSSIFDNKDVWDLTV